MPDADYNGVTTFDFAATDDGALLLDTGDLNGAATRRKIIKVIEVMQATEPSGSTH